MAVESKTLQNNKITQFILRIDIMPGMSVDFKKLAETLSTDYGTVRTELHVNYQVDMDKVEVNKEEFLTYILGKAPNVTLQLNCFERSIVLTSNHYNDNSVYKDKVNRIITLLKEYHPGLAASRIGMRFINTFPCTKPADIGKYLTTGETNSLKDTLKRDKVSRAILVHEYQHGDYQVRVQCGIPNKFYPSIITNYELVLDIDVYGIGSQSIDRWEESIRDYNHGAYDCFIAYVKPNLLSDMQ